MNCSIRKMDLKCNKNGILSSFLIRIRFLIEKLLTQAQKNNLKEKSNHICSERKMSTIGGY